MVCVDGKPCWSKLYLNFPCFRNSHQVQANCNSSNCSRVGYQVLILEAQRCTRFSQRCAFDNLGKYKTTAHAWAKHFSMKNEAISKIEVLYLNALHSDREKLVGWSDFPNGIQEEEQVRKKICDKRWLRMSTPHADPKDLHSRVVFTFALQAPTKKTTGEFCCNLSGGVALIMWFTTNGMCVKNKTIIHEARASNSKRDQSWNRAVIFQPDPNPIPVVRNPTSEMKTRFWPENFLITVGYISVFHTVIL